MNKNIFTYRNYSRDLAIYTITDPKALTAIDEFEELFENRSTESLHKTIYSVSEILTETYVGKVIRIIGTLGGIGVPSPIDLEYQNGDVKRIPIISLTITDLRGAQIRCTLQHYDLFREKIELVQKNPYVIFEGTVLSQVYKSGYGEYSFYLKNITAEITPLDLIRDRDYNMQELKEKVEHYSKQNGGIRKFIKSELVENLNISGLDTAKELNKAIDFMILQSLSRGMSSQGMYCNKLHSLIIGPPASGKKLLTVIAKILNPIAFEISSTDGKVTPAGLIGRAVLKSNMTISIPGYLPSASRGIVCIQDFHELAKLGPNQKVFSIFSKMMEDGKVDDSTSAKKEHQAITALHVDMNRMSQVYSTGDGSAAMDLGIPKNVISRFDFIMEIPGDVGRQFEVIEQMLDGKKDLVSVEHDSGLPEWAKRLKRIVAYISTVYDRAEIDEKNSTYLKNCLTEALKDKLELASINTAEELVSTRIPISLLKYSKAIACSKLKTEVDEDDIDEAFDYLENKLNFLTYYTTSTKAPILKPKDSEIRHTLILKEFIGKEFGVNEIVELFKTKGLVVSEKTPQRDIKDLIDCGKMKKIKYGVYKLL